MSKNDSLDDIFTALSDKTRRSILERLFEGEARVTDLAAPYKMSLNSVSKHILILERADLVTRRKSGREHYIKFNADTAETALKWLQNQRGAWRSAKPKEKTVSAASTNDNDDKKKPAWKFWG